MTPTPGSQGKQSGDAESLAARESARIRGLYAARDRKRQPHRAFVEAYRRLNVERRALTEHLLRNVAPPPHGRLIDVGCGAGLDLAAWVEAGWLPARIAGVDLSTERIDRARLAAPGVDIRLGSGATLPFDDQAFDAATAVTVFSSTLDAAVRSALFGEMVRIVRPGGLVVVYDFVVRKPTNPHVRAMPLRRLAELGRPPDGSRRLSPLLHAVAAGAFVHPSVADLAWRLAPRTHRLSWWRVAATGC